VVIDGVFDAVTTGGLTFTAATGLEANAIAYVQTGVRRRLLRYCARPLFALDRLREHDHEHLIYDHPQPGPSARSALILTPLELLDRIAVLMPPPHIHRHFGAPVRTEISVATSTVSRWPIPPVDGVRLSACRHGKSGRQTHFKRAPESDRTVLTAWSDCDGAGQSLSGANWTIRLPRICNCRRYGGRGGDWQVALIVDIRDRCVDLAQ
jgi:hypothetical protein